VIVQCSYFLFQTNFIYNATDNTENHTDRMSKITNDGLTRSDTGCFIAVPIWQQWASKGYTRKLWNENVLKNNKQLNKTDYSNSFGHSISREGQCFIANAVDCRKSNRNSVDIADLLGAVSGSTCWLKWKQLNYGVRETTNRPNKINAKAFVSTARR